MDARKKSKLPLPWPGWIWAVGNLGLGLAALIFFILRDVGAFVSVMPFPLDSNNLEVLFSIVQIAPALIVSGVVMLKDKGAGWLAAVLTQGIILALAIINRASSMVDYTTSTCFQELMRRYFLVAVAAVSVIWLVYFFLARKRYRTEPGGDKPALEWKGWLWSLGNVVLGACGILLYTLSVGDKYFVSLQFLTDFLWDLGLLHYVFDIFPVMIIAGVVMLESRKPGYLAALTSLVVIAMLFSVSVFVKVRLNFYTSFKHIISVENISLLVQYGLTVAWLVYFIKARKRYGIGNQRED